MTNADLIRYYLGIKYQQGMETSFKTHFSLASPIHYSSLTSAIIVSPKIMYMRDFVL